MNKKLNKKGYLMNKKHDKKGRFGTTISDKDFQTLKRMVINATLYEEIFKFLNEKYPNAEQDTKYRWLERAAIDKQP